MLLQFFVLEKLSDRLPLLFGPLLVHLTQAQVRLKFVAQSHFYEVAQVTDLSFFVCVEIVPKLAAGSQLRQVVIQRLFTHTYCFGSLVERHAMVVEVFVVVAVVESAPLSDFFNDVPHVAFTASRASFTP